MISTTTQRSAQDLARLHDEYLGKMDAAVADNRPDLVEELSAAYAREAGLSAPAQPGSATRRHSRSLLRRLDRYTLRVYNPSWPYGATHPRDAR